MKLADYKEIYYNGIELKEILWNGVTQWKKSAVTYSIVAGPKSDGSKELPLSINLSSGETEKASYTWIIKKIGSDGSSQELDTGTEYTSSYSWSESNAGKQDVLKTESHSVSFEGISYTFNVYVYVSYDEIPSYECSYCGTDTTESDGICQDCKDKRDEGLDWCDNCGIWTVFDEDGNCPYCS